MMQQNGNGSQGGTLRLQPNVPAEIALKFRDGREVEGNFGPQVMFTLVDGRKLYLNPGPAERIRELGVRPGERFSICKRNGDGNSVRWEVARLDPPARGEAVPGTPGAASAPTALESQLRASIDHVERSKAANGTAEAVSLDAATMTTALRIAVDALASTESYAKKQHGLDVEFGPEDIRAVALSLYISRARERGYAA